MAATDTNARNNLNNEKQTHVYIPKTKIVELENHSFKDQETYQILCILQNPELNEEEKICEINFWLQGVYLFAPFPYPLQIGFVVLNFYKLSIQMNLKARADFFYQYAFKIFIKYFKISKNQSDIFRSALFDSFEGFVKIFDNKVKKSKKKWFEWRGPLGLNLVQMVTLGGNLKILKFLFGKISFQQWYISFESICHLQFEKLGLGFSCNLFNLAVIVDSPEILQFLWQVFRDQFKKDLRLILLWEDTLYLARKSLFYRCSKYMLMLEPTLVGSSFFRMKLDNRAMQLGNVFCFSWNHHYFNCETCLHKLIKSPVLTSSLIFNFEKIIQEVESQLGALAGIFPMSCEISDKALAITIDIIKKQDLCLGITFQKTDQKEPAIPQPKSFTPQLHEFKSQKRKKQTEDPSMTGAEKTLFKKMKAKS